MVENLATKSEKTAILSETLRQQYLKSMGVQTWFDPLIVASKIEAVSVQKISAEIASTAPAPASASIAPVVPENDSAEKIAENLSLESLDSLSVKISQCELCELHTNRQQTISGEGNAEANIFIVIDAPILDSASDYSLLSADNKKMLKAILQTIGCDLSSVFITSLVKCRPAENKQPQTSEMICCDDYLSAQIKIIQPDVILVLGERACQQLLVSQKSLSDLRLRDHKHLGIPIYASYHPQALFASSQTKRKVWADLLQIKQHLNKDI